MKRTIIGICLTLLCHLATAAPININIADADQIAHALNGIGPSKAAAIVAFRDKNGPFKRIEELAYVKGIGNKTLNAIETDIVILSNKDTNIKN